MKALVGRTVALVWLCMPWGAPAAADSASFSSVGLSPGASGAEVYSHVCQGCHMPQAQGAVGAGHYPALAGNPALVSWQYVALTVINGKKGMPGFGVAPEPGMERFSARLTDAQIAEVVNFVRGNFGNHHQGKVTAAQVVALPHSGTVPIP